MSFISYGMGSLRPLVNGGGSLYDRIVPDVTVDVCAQLCLNESSFYCQSFDFSYNLPSNPSNRSSLIQEPAVLAACQLSQHSTASVGGFLVDRQRNHYERIGILIFKYLSTIVIYHGYLYCYIIVHRLEDGDGGGSVVSILFVHSCIIEKTFL